MAICCERGASRVVMRGLTLAAHPRCCLRLQRACLLMVVQACACDGGGLTVGGARVALKANMCAACKRRGSLKSAVVRRWVVGGGATAAAGRVEAMPCGP